MKIFRILSDWIITPVAALAGNWVGGQIRTRVTGEPTATIHFEHTTESGLHMDNYPINTKFYPALLFSLIGQPRWLFAFWGGVLASLWISDEYEALFLENVLAPLFEKRLLGNRD